MLDHQRAEARNALISLGTELSNAATKIADDTAIGDLDGALTRAEDGIEVWRTKYLGDVKNPRDFRATKNTPLHAERTR
jgi:hypothetical protein